MKGRNFIRFNSGKKAAASPARSQKKIGRKNNNMLKGAGILALVLVGATSLGLITGQNGSVNGGVKIVKASSLPHIDSLKSQMANSANKSVINILEIVPEKNVKDSTLPMYSGELGYLVEGQEGVNFESVLTSIKNPENKVSGKSLREKWANNYLTSLVSLGIMSDRSDAKVDEYPLTANYVEKDNNGGKTYYKEEYPWEYDDPNVKDKEGYKPLSVNESVKAEVKSVDEKENGDWIAPPSSFSIDTEGSYRQDITEFVKASEDILNGDLKKYLFYKADESNMKEYSPSELSELDPKSLSNIFFRKRSDVKDAEWSYTDVSSTGFDHDYTYASLIKLDNTTVMTGKDFKAAVDKGSVTLSDWYCSDGDIIKADKDEQSYLAVNDINKTKGVTLTYAGPGKGNCSLSGITYPDGSDDKDLYTLSFNTTYYKGGYSNNNWFLRYVMNYDESDVSSASDSDKESALKALLSKRAKSVKIDSVAAPDVLISKFDNSQTGQSLNLSDYDMIYISDGIGLCRPADGSADPVGNVPAYSDAEKYSKTPDAEGKVYDISPEVSTYISGTYASNQPETGLGKFVMYDTDILTVKDGSNVSEKASKSNASGLISNLMKKSVYNSSVSGDDLIDAASSTVTGQINGQIDDKFKDGYVYNNSFGFTVNEADTTVTGGRQSSVSAAFNKPYDNKRYTDASSGFFDVYEEITHENNVSVTTGGKKFLDDTSLDEADVLRYAINYSGRRPNNKKSVINVLDIEPDKWSEITERNTPGTGDGNVHASPDFRRILGNGIYNIDNGKDSIRITTMSVAEFIGKTEDIAEKYDMVYIGGEKEKVPSIHKNLLIADDFKSGKSDPYTDYLYYNIGPEYNIQNEAGQGMLDTDYTPNGNGVSHDSAKNNLKYRKSGNDLSKSKMKELIKYANLGYPVILGGTLAKNSHTFYLRAASKNGQRAKSVSLSFYDKNGSLVSIDNKQTVYQMEKYSSSDDDNLWYYIATDDILSNADGVQATINYDGSKSITSILKWDDHSSIPNMIAGCSDNETKIMGETIDKSGNGDSFTVYLWNADGWVAPKIEAVYGYDQSSIKSRDYDMEKVNTNLWKCVIPKQADNTLSYYSYYDSTKTNTSGPIRDLNSGNIFIAQQAKGSGTYDNSYSWSTFDKAGNSDHEIEINEGIADNTSYMYQALMSVRHNDNLMGYYYAKQNPLKVYYAANLSKPEINFLRFTTDDDSSNKNGDKSGDTNGDGKFSMEDGTPVNYHSGDAELPADKLQYTLVKNENSDTFTMKWHLQIVNATEPDVQNDTYTVHLYLDSNGDGLFNEDEEINNLTVTNDTGTISSNGKSFENSDGSAPAKTFNLKCDLDTQHAPVYTISRDIPTGVHGVIPWKLMVESNGETGFHASETGYSYFRSDKKDQIKVLQIRSDGGNGADLSNINDQKIKKIQDFDITIHTVRPKSGISGIVNGGKKFNEWKYEDLNKYDMIICGFGDSWGDLDNNGANLLARYIDDGRPLMVAHDTASFNNMRWDLRNQRQYVGGLSAWNSFWFNDILRDKVKLDIYGVSNRYSYNEAGVKVKNDGIQIGGQKYKGKYYNNQYGISYYDDPTYLYNSGVVAQGNEIPNKTILRTIQNAGYRVAYKPGYGVWDDSTKSSTTDSKLVSSKFKSVNNTQGFTNFLIDWVRNKDGNKYGGLSTTTQVEQVNKGQLTTYPFDVNTKNFGGTDDKLKNSNYMTIAQTHFQYYQLNMDADKIVCWYTLANGDQGRYAYSPQDVVNQYYIFSCGNITYTGAGHSNNMSDDETNLFINTMIAAYRKQQTGASASFMASAAGDQKLSNGTTVVLTNKDSMKDYDDTSDGKTESNLYNYGMFGDTTMNGSYAIDQRVTSVGGGTARVYFRVTDPNIGSSYIGVRFDYEGADQGGNPKYCTISADKYEQINNAESGYTIHRADGSDETYDREIGIRSGITYYIDLPESLTNWLNSDKNTDHSVELELKATVYNTDTGNEIKPNGDDNVAKIKLSSMNLFPIG